MVSISAGLVLAACSSTSISPNAPNAQDEANEQLALKNLMCAFDPHPQGKQSPCAHMIENRLLLSRFFAPETLGGLDEAEKFRGRRITTRFIVEAAAKIKQCRKVTEEAITIIRDIKIDDGTYFLKGTKPLSEADSACFLIPKPEGS